MSLNQFDCILKYPILNEKPWLRIYLPPIKPISHYSIICYYLTKLEFIVISISNRFGEFVFATKH